MELFGFLAFIWVLSLSGDVSGLKTEIKKIKQADITDNTVGEEDDSMEKSLRDSMGKQCEIILLGGSTVKGTVTTVESNAFTIENDKTIDTYRISDVWRIRIKK